MAGESPEMRDVLLDAALAHVPFDGWSDASFRAAIADTGADPALARALFPRGATDMALAFHARGDAAMVERLRAADLGAMRYRDRVAAAVRWRLEAVGDKELVRRGTTLFALPSHAGDGARAIWGTADRIWEALGDTSRDGNWYSKRATLSAVYSATLLFWLGDESEGNAATWAFLDRRIDDVMRIEKLKAAVNGNPLLKPFMAAPNWLFAQLRAPERRGDFPGAGDPRT